MKRSSEAGAHCLGGKLSRLNANGEPLAKPLRIQAGTCGSLRTNPLPSGMFMKRTASLLLFASLGAFASGTVAYAQEKPAATPATAEAPAALRKAAEKPVLPPVVSVLAATKAEMVDSVLLTGTLAPREEILVGPEIEGMRILELLVDEGDKVTKGQVLARLSRETLDAQMAQSLATQQRADASIAQAKSQIAQWEALVAQKSAAFSRADALRKQGVTTDASLENATTDYRTAQANLATSRDAQRVAEAEIASILALRQELSVRIGRTEVRAAEGGIVSRRSARVGAVASAVGDPMFRIIAKADIELEAEVPELRLAKLRPGMPASITIGDVATLGGKVRLVSPEVEKTSRLGKVRVAVDKSDALRIGAFARGDIEVSRRSVIALPLSAVLYDAKGPYVQSVRDNVVYAAPVKTGLIAEGLVEIVSGVFEDETVIAKAGSFLHDGDKVRTVFLTPKPAALRPGPQAQGVTKSAGHAQAESN